MIVTGPYLDVKGSQSRPYAVTLYEPGARSEVERFASQEQAQAFADQQRELHPRQGAA